MRRQSAEQRYTDGLFVVSTVTVCIDLGHPLLFYQVTQLDALRITEEDVVLDTHRICGLQAFPNRG